MNAVEHLSGLANDLIDAQGSWNELQSSSF